MGTAGAPATSWAVLALLFNALVWGLSWWPFRQLEAQGLHPLWATVVVYALTVLALTLWRPATWGTLARTPSLWILVLAAGTTNAAFNSAVTLGDVVRVVLLFYLMPAWAVLLARVFLAVPIGAPALLRVALALAGAAVVLWPVQGSGWPLPRTTAEWLGLLGGASFALNNVMLRREAHRPAQARALAMFAGGAVVSLVVALILGSRGLVPAPSLSASWWPGALALGAVFLVGNLALQYGAARLRPDVTAIVLVTEVLFASGSAVLLGAGSLTPALLIGGSLIVGASVLAARSPQD